MRSIRTKITVLTLCAVIVVLSVTTVLTVVSIRNLGSDSSNQILYLLCEEGQKNLNAYFKSVEQSVETISGYASYDLTQIDLSDLKSHIKRVGEIFEKTANNTSGILTYYYRIDPEVPTDEKGFWFVNLDGNGFKEHEVTDISLYDTEDQSSLVWFTVPKAYGDSIWLPPYVTDNLDVYVLSYNVPVYQGETFIGVIGIELDYNLIAEPVDNITLFENGYAFINDTEGNIIYSPRMTMEELTSDTKPKVPDGLLSDKEYVSYNYNGVDKQAVWLPLSNGMRLNVAVPISEINAEWQNLTVRILLVSTILLLVIVVVTMRLTKHITIPLRKLTQAAAEVDAGNYDVKLDYEGKDEIGRLTRSFSMLIFHLKKHIKELNDLAYSDPLTSVHNKGAFDLYLKKLESRVNDPGDDHEFAIGVFDCNNLKQINDNYGHESGDIYLKRSASLICKVFNHSPVFRIGGDEFAVIIQNENYKNLDSLIDEFSKKTAEIIESDNDHWEKANVAMGIAVYDSEKDKTVEDVVRRADELMYENKSKLKAGK